MSKISALLQSAYRNEYSLSLKKLYSEPKLYDAGGDLSKRWYVYFTFRDPKSDKLVPQTPIYTGLARHKNLRDRRAAAKVLIQALSIILKNGYNPYSDSDTQIDVIRKMGIMTAVNFVLRLKENHYGAAYYNILKSRLTRFATWLLANGFEGRYINAVNRTAVINYLNHVASETSASNRNNTRSDLSVFFAALVDNEIIEHNFISSINVLQTTPVRNKSYTPVQEKEIFDHLEKVNPRLLLFIKFVSYNFIRPIEVCRLRIGDLDLKGKTMVFQAKRKAVKTKIIPDILIEEIPDLRGYPKDAFLFGYTGIGQYWDAGEPRRREHYTTMFREHVKDHFKLGVDFTIYSFRHTFTLKLYKKLRETYTPFESRSKLMLITGHASMSALEKYLRDLDVELPEDFSNLLR